MAEYYGFTPQQTGELTIYQACALLASEEEIENSGKQKMSVTEYRRMVKRGKF